MTARDEIAAAANTAAAVDVKAFYRQSTKPGDGWVQYARTDYPNPFGGMVTWQVVLVIPQGTPAGEKWIEANQLAVVSALGDAMSVRSARPAEIAIDAGTVPVLVIEGQREEG